MINQTFEGQIRCMRVGILFSILAILFGLILGLIFGAGEAVFKERLAQSAQAVLNTTYGGDEAKMKAVKDKAWVYMQRAHLHAGAMGTTALVLSLLLPVCNFPLTLARITSGALGIGALGYSLYWMWAGFRAPGLGGTHEARESLDWLAIPTSGMFVLATLIVLFGFLRTCFFRKKHPQEA